MRTSNPALNDRAFSQYAGPFAASQTMTVAGAIDKTAILLILVLAGALFTWHRFFTAGQDIAAISGFMIAGILGGLVLALITVFKPSASPITAPIYAVCEGLALGGISAVVEASYQGLPLQAVGLTIGTLLCMLVVYRAGWIKVTRGFALGVAAATGAVAIFYLIAFVLSMFGVTALNSVFGNGLIGIGFSLLVVGIAAMNLVLDFEVIVQGANYNAPKYMEWYGAFGLLVTLVWLYIEILRLLVKLRGRD